jgi:hypothetical protein
MTTMANALQASQRAQIAALQAGIKVLTDWRRRHYGPGHWAYESGVRDLTFAEDGHKHYQEYSEHIHQLEDLIEIITDPGCTFSEEDHSDLPLFSGSL